jgi:hypothetical protein
MATEQTEVRECERMHIMKLKSQTELQYNVAVLSTVIAFLRRVLLRRSLQNFHGWHKVRHENFCPKLNTWLSSYFTHEYWPAYLSDYIGVKLRREIFILYFNFNFDFIFSD